MMKDYARWLWILSGLPVAAALIAMPQSIIGWCFAIMIVLDTSHSFSPIVLAWTHNEFRRKMIYSNLRKFVLLPICAFATALGIGLVAAIGWTSWTPNMGLIYSPSQLLYSQNPFWLLVAFYSAWNLYHFSMQNFGVALLCKVPFDRKMCMAFAFGGTVMLVFVLPYFFRVPWMAMVTLGVISVNHWVVSIGLCCRTVKWNLLFILGILSLGAIGFVWVKPTPSGLELRHVAIPVLLCARLGLGFVHFLYDRWVWKLSDPRIRAIVGQALI